MTVPTFDVSGRAKNAFDLGCRRRRATGLRRARYRDGDARGDRRRAGDGRSGRSRRGRRGRRRCRRRGGRRRRRDGRRSCRRRHFRGRGRGRGQQYRGEALQRRRMRQKGERESSTPHTSSVATPPKILGIIRDDGVDPRSVEPAETGRVVHRPGPDGRTRAVRALRRRRPVTPARWSIRADAPARSIIAGMRAARAWRAARIPSRIAGWNTRRRETPYRSSGYVNPIATCGAWPAKATRLATWNELTMARSASPRRTIAPATSSRRRSASGRRAGRRRAPARNSSASSSVAGSGPSSASEWPREKRAVALGRAHRTRSRRPSLARGDLERAQRVLWRELAAAPRCPHSGSGGPSSLKQLHGAPSSGGSLVELAALRAAYWTIIRSVTHSTGARSSVHRGAPPLCVTGRNGHAAADPQTDSSAPAAPAGGEDRSGRVGRQQDLVEAERRPERHADGNSRV